MIWRPFTLLLILFAVSPCRADIPALVDSMAGRMCRPAVAAAERSFNIPSHLLLAIARVESGRHDPASGAFAPWPWTVNADGQGYFYESKAEAITAVQTMRKQGTHSIDVGCMQISLLHHPDAFATLDQAFDPIANASFGARFLNELHDKAQSWPRAVEMYHSATPEIGQPYGQMVYAALPAEQRLAGASPTDNLAAAWSATLTRSPFGGTFSPSPMRIIPMASGGGMGSAGGAVVGRTLESYRMAPVRLAARSP